MWNFGISLYGLYILLQFGRCQSAPPQDAVRWTPSNCPNGIVVDAVCAIDESCGAFSTPEVCHSLDKCVWSSKGDGRCVLNRDSFNNVCTELEVNPICANITRGICPERFIVDKNCCTSDSDKFKGILEVDDPNKVCCNTPCASSETNGCSLPASCAPEARSYGTNHGPGYFGFNPTYIQQLLHGVGPNRSPYQLGQIVSGYGSLSHLNLPDSLKNTGESKDKHVAEITADDVITSLIEALQNDRDVVSYNAEIISHPTLGKQKFGGVEFQYRFPDANMMIDKIYGTSNPSNPLAGQYHPNQYSVGYPTLGYNGVNVYGGGYRYVPQNYGSQYRHGAYGFESTYGYGNNQYGNNYVPGNKYGNYYGYDKHGYANNGYSNDGYGNSNGYGTNYGHSKKNGYGHSGGYGNTAGYVNKDGYGDPYGYGVGYNGYNNYNGNNYIHHPYGYGNNGRSCSQQTYSSHGNLGVGYQNGNYGGSHTNYPGDYNYRGGSNSQYGSGSNSNYGSGSHTNYGGGSNSNYGGGSNSNYGSGSNSNYGSGTNSNYGGGSNSNYGGGSNSKYGGGSNSHYGSASNTKYGSNSYGGSNSGHGSGYNNNYGGSRHGHVYTATEDSNSNNGSGNSYQGASSNDS